MLLRIGSRASPLAVAQAKEAMAHIANSSPGIEFELVTTLTTGDLSHAPFHQLNQQNVFTKEIEEMLLQNKIDVAIHSLKDVPVTPNERLEIAAVFSENDYRDCLLSRAGYKSISELPLQASVGTAATRRRAQLLYLRPDLNVVHIRGNILTRIRKMQDNNIDAIVLAAAGLNRLDIQGGIPIPITDMLPSAGQGVLAAQIRRGDKKIHQIIAKANQKKTWTRIQTERDFLSLMQVGCGDPVATMAIVENNIIDARFMILSNDGKHYYHTRHIGTDCHEVAARGANALKEYKHIWKSS